ncbi:EAP30/Vps36 family-domain-containing protein [Pseudomassariella vexata]|uniref:Vacuolar protein-sorting-associated protein 36 n=1 Tax=Pseudomassariella vexata TaxID=1141098 RepID=A0A1Y2E0U7_9PEZI|nr:EAP30/Vps36 family-domain-containing protein [Pseudomassariella vexata]ORY65160.1 EAP30/Vps36 family-domain-containing protein [Pseudomassariella vexata]
MFLKQIDLTTALRPSYLPDEVLLFVQDNVGLYEGKYKLPNLQNGQVYLTSHRICYVDKQEPRKHSVALDLKDVERYEFYAGFLKSSAKVTLVPKPPKRGSLQSRAAAVSSSPSNSGTTSPLPSSDGPFRSPSTGASQATAATWVCTICSFPNPVPSNFDPTTANAHTPLPPCLACGIKPALTHVLKAAISNVTSRQMTATGSSFGTPLPLRPGLDSSRNAATELGDLVQTNSASTTPKPTTPDTGAGFQCPRCTFLNHPSLLSCEICGAPLISHDVPPLPVAHEQPRTDSPGPTLNFGKVTGLDNPDSVKISFRNGGEKIFYERLKGSMTQRKWLLQEAPPVPNSSSGTDDGTGSLSRSGSGPGRTRKTAGIAGLEQMGLERRKNNEFAIANSFEDLEALMASAKEIVALAESFARQGNGGADSATSEANALLAESASQLGLITTKDIVGGGSGSGSENLYLSELARNLAEFLTDDSRGVLKKAGGIISLVDLWAMFNRARGGVELVSPNDFEKAAQQWEKLKLPVRLRTFKSGVMVVQGSDRTDETTIKALLVWLRDLHDVPPEREVAWDWQEFGRGVTAQDAAEKFGWSIGVAEEELEMAEERGVLCREEGIEGLKFWENFIDTGERRRRRRRTPTQTDQIIKALNDSGLI